MHIFVGSGLCRSDQQPLPETEKMGFDFGFAGRTDGPSYLLSRMPVEPATSTMHQMLFRMSVGSLAGPAVQPTN